MFGPIWWFFFQGADNGPAPEFGEPMISRKVMAQRWRVLRPDLPDIVEGETLVLGLDLTAALQGERTVEAVSFEAQPSGLAFADAVVTGGGRMVQVAISGTRSTTVHTVTAVCTLSDGAVVRPWTTLRVKEAGE